MTQPTLEHHRAARAIAVSRESIRRAWIAGLSFALVLVAWSFAAQAGTAPNSFADLAERLLPTVVNIATTQTVESNRGEEFEEFFKEFFERRGGQPPPQEKRRASALGSGFIIDASGYIVTNHHVIADADEITVRLHDDTLLEAELVGSDEKTDLALLKVKSDEPLPATSWGVSEKTRIGDWVVAIGNPFGLGGTVTAGIVSARQRDINSGPYDDFIQTDAAINRGNSGGPMFNLDGDVIGVNTAIFSPSGGSIGIGFAIPSDIAKNIVAQLREHGEVRRGWLGVRIQTVTEELAEGLRLDGAYGALVASVTEGGPAEKAGIAGGDVILQFNGRTVPDMRKLPRMVAETPIGREVDVVVWRKGAEIVVKVVLGELDDEQLAARHGRPLGRGEIRQGAGPRPGAGRADARDARALRPRRQRQGRGHYRCRCRRFGRREGPQAGRRDRRGRSGGSDESGTGQRTGQESQGRRIPGGHAAGVSRGRLPMGRRAHRQELSDQRFKIRTRPAGSPAGKAAR